MSYFPNDRYFIEAGKINRVIIHDVEYRRDQNINRILPSHVVPPLAKNRIFIRKLMELWQYSQKDKGTRTSERIITKGEENKKASKVSILSKTQNAAIFLIGGQIQSWKYFWVIAFGLFYQRIFPQVLEQAVSGPSNEIIAE